MKVSKSYAVFGLGRYGYAVATELVNSGAEVLAIDMDQTTVNSAIADIPYCKCADVTDAEVIRRLGIANMDAVIVAMANHLEASVMAVMLCKEAGVNTVIAKGSDEMHCKVLSRVGADRVVFPESESGKRLAKNLLSSGFVDVVDLSDGVSIIELDVKPEWVGHSLIELDLRKKYSVNIIAIRCGETLRVDIDPKMPLTEDMNLVVITDSSKLSKLK